MSRPLCCCEYIDEDGERNHILGCCCNCVELDECCERLVTGRKIPWRIIKSIIMTGSDRFRIPWLFGARKVSLDALLPIILLPTFILCAAQGVWMSVVAFAFLPIFLIYVHFLYTKFHSQTNFFFSWNITSIVFTFFLFEFVGVNILEIREDENFVFCSFTVAVFFSLYKVKKKERLSYVNNEHQYSQIKLDNYCQVCNIRVPARTYHCFTCQVCFLQRDQHCAWLNCCIAQYNHSWYMIFLLFHFSYLVLCSNLILTTACHPFRVWGAIMLPDDCSDVYYDSQFAICFVTSLYCIEASIFIGSILIHECWLISIGMTGHEFRNRSKRTLCCGLFASRPYSKGFIRNWLSYFKGENILLQYYNI
ncbi:hypothetical protein O3M35_008386 [Rhynocoris fuscipes]|uniref:Palmitoyltransferase n=1 Tax=Rhynocoris fuscipes TaxID=488301 RepID=A0AAW1DBC5_9HEMI